MSLFFLAIFTIYGGVHVYAFLKARQALGFGWAAGAGLALFMAVMVAGIILVRLLERHGFELGARTLAYVAYLWMAVLFLFFCGSLVIDILHLLLRAGGAFGWHGASRWMVPARTAFFGCLGLSIMICVYGYFDALNIRTERFIVETAKLPPGTDRLTIVQVSDVHLGLIVRCDRLVAILEKVKEAKPDLFLSTGDLVDAQIDHLSGLRELLQEIRPKYGKFAITGNHEYYAGIEKALKFTRQSGFTMLRGDSRDLGPIGIAGVDDRTGVRLGVDRPESDQTVIEALDRRKFVLFLKHQPLPDPDAIGRFDLMLSGHTHKGQIWPFTYLSMLTYPMNAGRYDLGKGSVLRVSRGTGTWGPPIRFLSSPEVTVIELVRKT